MKNLSLIRVGKYAISATVEHEGGHVLKITVTYGLESLNGKMAEQGPHDRTEAAFEKSVNEFARRLAEELAGRLRSEELARKFAAG